MYLYGDRMEGTSQRIALSSGDVPVAVYGLGKMGLPLAAVYAERTGNVTGVDIDESVVDSLNAGESHIEGEPGLSELVEELVEEGAFAATTDIAAAAADASIHVVIVPTPIDDENEPDLSILEGALEGIADGLSVGDTVFVECTVPPGTCRDVVVPLLSERSGLDPGTFGVAACPERTSSGRALQDIRGAYPKIVGGVDEESTRVATTVYELLVDNDVIAVSDATTAEAVKVFEGVYRDVNIALANELATLADGLDISVNEAIEAANTQPFSHIHAPGPGVGGHCIPWYPHFLMSRVREETPLIRTAREVNDSMPEFTVRKTAEELAAVGKDVEGARVAVLGVTYRPGIAETRASPSIPIIRKFAERGATVFGVDPLVDPADYGAEPLSVEQLADADLDAVVMVTPHAEFEEIEWERLDDPVVLDGRRTLREIPHRVYTIGGR